MKQSNVLRPIIYNKTIAIISAIIVFFMAHPLCAHAQNLNNAKTVLESFRDQLKTIIPVAAAIILLGLAIGYAGRYIEKGTFVRWAIGVVVAGSATQLANMLFGAG